MRSLQEALEGPQAAGCPTLGLSFLVYTMRAWTPAWTPKMSSVTGGLGRSPPAVTETPRPRRKGVPTSPSFPHLSELLSVARQQAAQRGHRNMGTSHLRVSCGVRWEMLFKTRFRRILKPRCQPRTILTLVRGAQNWGGPSCTFPWMCDCSEQDTSPQAILLPGEAACWPCPGWGRSVEQEEAGEFSAAGQHCPSLRPNGPDEGFCPFL